MQIEVRKAREKDALVKENPFAAFLAARRPGTGGPTKPPSSGLEWPPQESQELTRPVDEGLACSPAADHFSTFLSQRPTRDVRTPQTEQLLREEVIRAKRQLLEVTLQTELRALDPASKEEDVAESLERLRRAHDYLRNPERSLEDGARASSAAAPRSKNPPPYVDISVMMADTTAPLSPIQPAWSPMSTSLSMPNLQASSSSFLPNISGDSSRPGVFLHGSSRAKEDPLLSGWWSKTRCWNIGVSKKDIKARRQTLGLPGGTVVLGNGRMPNFNDSRLLAKGCFFAFQIDEIDDDHFPLDKLKDMSLVLGVSKYPARHRLCERPMYAYEVPDAVLLGYGGHLIDKGRWMKTSWDSKGLKREDIIGLLVTEEGDLVVFVNEKQVLRVKTSLNDELYQSQEVLTTPMGLLSMSEVDMTRQASTQSRASRRGSANGPRPVKRVLFPILDLHGRVSAVTLLPRMAPPNVPLGCRNKLPG